MQRQENHNIISSHSYPAINCDSKLHTVALQESVLTQIIYKSFAYFW